MRKLVVGTFLTVDGGCKPQAVPTKTAMAGSNTAEAGSLLRRRHGTAHHRVEQPGRRAASRAKDLRDLRCALAAHARRRPGGIEADSVPKYVASRTLDTVAWNNSTLLDGDVPREVADLKEQPGQEIQVTGSGDSIQTLMKHDLVDEYRLWIFPVLLGDGKRLFADATIPRSLRLLDTKTSSTGVTIHTYERGGTLDYGSFALEQ